MLFKIDDIIADTREAGSEEDIPLLGVGVVFAIRDVEMEAQWGNIQMTHPFPAAFKTFRIVCNLSDG